MGEFKNYCNQFGISIHATSPGVSRGNGQVKRVMATLNNGPVLIKNNPRNQTSLDLKFSVPYEVHRVLQNDRYLVKKVVGQRGRFRKVAHDQVRRAPQPAAGHQAAVSPSEAEAGPSQINLTPLI